MSESWVRESPLTFQITLAKALPRIRQALDEPQKLTAKDLKNIAIYFNSASRVVSSDLMNRFSDIISEKIDSGVFKESGLGTLCKVLSLSLTKRDWHVDKADFTRKVI